MKSWSVRYFIQIPGNWTFCGCQPHDVQLHMSLPFLSYHHLAHYNTRTTSWQSQRDGGRKSVSIHIYFFFLNDKLWRQLWGGFFSPCCSFLILPLSIGKGFFFSLILSDYCYYPTEKFLNKYEIEKLASYYHYPLQIWKFWPTTLSSCILMGFAYNSVTSKHQEKRKLLKFTYIYLYYLFVLIQLSLLR